MQGLWKTVAGLTCLLLGIGSLGIAEVNAQGLINYQGALRDATGVRVDGSVSILFEIYESAVDDGSDPVWSEPHNSVVVTSGVFNVLLGSANPFSSSLFDGETQLWIQTTIDGEELVPRRPLTATPYAFHALHADVGDVDVLNASVAAPLRLESSGGLFEELINLGPHWTVSRTTISRLGVQYLTFSFEDDPFPHLPRWTRFNTKVLVGDDLRVSGTTQTEILKITGGSDLAEQFQASGSTEELAPGSVVSIDPQHPGKLVICSEAYDRRVAGIISGAGQLNSGLVMGQTGTVADGDIPVALTGRVYCYVDASIAAVTPGDLLTTSDTPGHAMRVTDYGRAQGAILGKAMTPLRSGRGLVLVLVSLQ